MESTAKLKFLRRTPRKTRLVADAVRGKRVSEAISVLQFGINKGAADDVSKLIRSAVANMQNKNAEVSIDTESLYVKTIVVEEGPVLKRFRPSAHGRASRILKHMCHISVTIAN